jgi:hypothetical protein
MVHPQHIDQLNRSIMRLLRPSHLRQEDWTDFYTTKYTHPEDGRTVLALPEDEYVPIHVEADGAELQQILSVFVSDNAITQEEANQIVAGIQGNAGQNVRIADFIPPSWQEYIFTEEQMHEDGWWPDNDLTIETPMI